VQESDGELDLLLAGPDCEQETMSNLRCLLCALWLCFTAVPTHADPNELETVRLIASRLSDLTATAVARDVNSKEITRLKQSAQVLQFKRLQFFYKLPDKFRVDSRFREMFRVSMVQNGDRKTVRTSLGLRRSRNVADDPAKKQSPLDFGLLSSGLWNDYRVQVLSEETYEGALCLVLRLTLIEDPAYGHHKLWLDRKTLRILRRERYNGEGALKVSYLFKQPELSGSGLWYSRRIELYSPTGHFVGALELQDVRINQGVTDELFR
jgi:outer membrane lipoprotein-sorting protein